MSLVHAPIHDLLIRIKNAYLARKTEVSGVQHSKFREATCELLKQYKFIKDFAVETHDGSAKKFLKISLNPVRNPRDDVPVIKFFSKPSRPRYTGYKELHPVAGGRGIGIISTSQGLMATHRAKSLKIGGQLIAEIY